MRANLADKIEAGRIREGHFASDASFGACGAFRVRGPCGAELLIMAGAADLPESEGWEHVSVSTERRCPNWREMSFVKDAFWYDNELVMQFHVPAFDHINVHPYCLHLWRAPFDITLPPSVLVA